MSRFDGYKKLNLVITDMTSFRDTKKEIKGGNNVYFQDDYLPKEMLSFGSLLLHFSHKNSRNLDRNISFIRTLFIECIDTDTI